VIFDCRFVAARHEDKVFDTRFAGLIHDILDDRAIHDRQHFFWQGLGRR